MIRADLDIGCIITIEFFLVIIVDMQYNAITSAWGESPLDICSEIVSYVDPSFVPVAKFTKDPSHTECIIVSESPLQVAFVRTTSVRGKCFLDIGDHVSYAYAGHHAVIGNVLVFSSPLHGVCWVNSRLQACGVLCGHDCAFKVHFDEITLYKSQVASKTFKFTGNPSAPFTKVPVVDYDAGSWPCFADAQTMVTTVGSYAVVRDSDGGSAVFRKTGLVHATKSMIVTESDDAYIVSKIR